MHDRRLPDGRLCANGASAVESVLGMQAATRGRWVVMPSGPVVEPVVVGLFAFGLAGAGALPSSLGRRYPTPDVAIVPPRPVLNVQ